jgi:hypothetical protein
MKRATPSSIDVEGLKPTARASASTSAYVAGTSPGCISTYSRTAVRPRFRSSSSTT